MNVNIFLEMRIFSRFPRSALSLKIPYTILVKFFGGTFVLLLPTYIKCLQCGLNLLPMQTVRKKYYLRFASRERKKNCIRVSKLLKAGMFG